MDGRPKRFNIDELADLGGVTRRTVRYYIQEGLLPAPLGVGRGRHYDSSHLGRLLHVKAEQEAGRSLDDIRARPHRPAGVSRLAAAVAAAVPRSVWRRLELAPGVELHIASGARWPSAARLDELATWCRRYRSSDSEGEE